MVRVLAATTFLLSIAIGCVTAQLQGRGVDLTLTPGAGGSDVVRAVLSKIDASGIFTSDNRFLRRIAFAQTRDGLRNDTYSDPAYHGGIWGVEEVQFNRTLDPTTYTQLNANDTIARIEAIFGVDWLNDVAWEDLRKPFFSGLAARLFLATIPEEIPLSSEFLAQASYYRRNYDPSTPEFEFLDDVTELVFSENEECTVYVDVTFVLDSSGSIGAGNYDKVRDYVHGFSDALDIGPEENQVGVIIFSEEPEIIFNLSRYHNKSELLNAIDMIPYRKGATNTGDALRLLINDSFTLEAGARLDDETIFRLAIVLTDGNSNRGEPVETAAAAVHAFEPAILVYVIAVGDSIGQEELEQIATAPEFIDHLDSFDADQLTAAQLDRSYQICFTATVPEEVGEPIIGVLDQGQQVRYSFPIPEQGITVRLCVQSGRIVFYASTSIPNPSQVLYDYRLECIDCDSCELYVDPDEVPVVGVVEPTLARRRREAAMNESTDLNIDVYTNFTLYVSVEGLQESNSFELGSDVGDTTEPESDESDNLAVIVGVTVAMATVAVLVLVGVAAVIGVVYHQKKHKSVSV